MTAKCNGMTTWARSDGVGQRDDGVGQRYDDKVQGMMTRGCEYSNNSKLRSQYQLVCQIIDPHFLMWEKNKCFI